MAGELDDLRHTATIDTGDGSVPLFDADGSCAAWRYLMVEATQPVELDVPLAAQGVVAVPSFATHARLDTRPLDNPGDARLELLDGAGAVIGVVAPGHAIPLGRASSVRSVCPTPHRLLFSLSI